MRRSGNDGGGGRGVRARCSTAVPLSTPPTDLIGDGCGGGLELRRALDVAETFANSRGLDGGDRRTAEGADERPDRYGHARCPQDPAWFERAPRVSTRAAPRWRPRRDHPRHSQVTFGFPFGIRHTSGVPLTSDQTTSPRSDRCQKPKLRNTRRHGNARHARGHRAFSDRAAVTERSQTRARSQSVLRRARGHRAFPDERRTIRSTSSAGGSSFRRRRRLAQREHAVNERNIHEGNDETSDRGRAVDSRDLGGGVRPRGIDHGGSRARRRHGWWNRYPCHTGSGNGRYL